MHAWETILAAVGGLLLGLGLGMTIARRQAHPVPAAREPEDLRLRSASSETRKRELGLSDTVQLDASRIGKTVSERPPVRPAERER